MLVVNFSLKHLFTIHTIYIPLSAGLFTLNKKYLWYYHSHDIFTDKDRYGGSREQEFTLSGNRPFSKMAAANSNWFKLNWAENQYQHLKVSLLFSDRTKFR